MNSVVAHISFAGGGLLLPARTPYEQELLVEHVLERARRNGAVRVVVHGQTWQVNYKGEGLTQGCVRCGRGLQSTWGATAPGGESYCVRCAFGTPNRTDAGVEEQRMARAALAAASRITDDVLLDQLVAFGISPDTLTALSLVPLVEVAWADGKVEDAEKRAILAAAGAAGLNEASAGHKLIEGCLSERPHTGLRKMWKQYITSVCATRSAEERDALKAELLQQARRVAEAAGGFLGMASKVSSQEQALLADIAAAFKGPADRRVPAVFGP
jgi:hypothetical protein